MSGLLLLIMMLGWAYGGVGIAVGAVIAATWLLAGAPFAVGMTAMATVMLPPLGDLPIPVLVGLLGGILLMMGDSIRESVPLLQALGIVTAWSLVLGGVGYGVTALAETFWLGAVALVLTAGLLTYALYRYLVVAVADIDDIAYEVEYSNRGRFNRAERMRSEPNRPGDST